MKKFLIVLAIFISANLFATEKVYVFDYAISAGKDFSNSKVLDTLTFVSETDNFEYEVFVSDHPFYNSLQENLIFIYNEYEKGEVLLRTKNIKIVRYFKCKDGIIVATKIKEIG